MIYQMTMGFAVIVFILLVSLGAEFGAPLWFFFASVPVSPALSFGLLSLIGHVCMSLEERARAKRRSAAAARLAKGR
ncbi:hypothetical protein [Aeromonas dhakensis]|uniref:hypothetical protein n=1 Tax=Aeromonas dhakensis TaxID=196024 RepID=UPI003F7A406D